MDPYLLFMYFWSNMFFALFRHRHEKSIIWYCQESYPEFLVLQVYHSSIDLDIDVSHITFNDHDWNVTFSTEWETCSCTHPSEILSDIFWWLHPQQDSYLHRIFSICGASVLLPSYIFVFKVIFGNLISHPCTLTFFFFPHSMINSHVHLDQFPTSDAPPFRIRSPNAHSLIYRDVRLSINFPTFCCSWNTPSLPFKEISQQRKHIHKLHLPSIHLRHHQWHSVLNVIRPRPSQVITTDRILFVDIIVLKRCSSSSP